VTRPPRRAGPLVALLLLCAAGCGPDVELRTLTVSRQLVPLSGAAREAFPERRAALRDRVYTDDFLVTVPGAEVVFRGVGVEGPCRLSYEVALPGWEPGVPRAVRTTVTLRGRAGEERVLERTRRTTLEEGESGARSSWALDPGFAIDELALSIELDGEDAAARIVLLRPWLEHEQRVAAAAPDARRVLLVTLDTFRADYLGCYGNRSVESPCFDALADESVVFRDCYSTTNVTKPSHTSIFTSLYSKDHGVTDNYKTLSAATPSMIEALRERGFRTAAFVAAFNFSPERSELYRRFDDYHPCVPRDRRAEDVHADLFPWLLEHRDEDFFAWVHYFDTHAPYAAPYPYNRMYRGDKRYAIPPQLSQDYDWLSVLKLGGVDVAKDLYRGEVSYLDDQFGRLVARLRELGLWESLTLVLTADHGEALGELGFVALHNGLSDATTHVPLMLKLPGGGARGVVEGLVSTIDIYPTLFDYLDLAVPHAVRGESLRPLIEGSRRSERPWVFSEHAHGLQVSLRTETQRFTLGLEDHELSRRYHTRAGGAELYDYSRRRVERANLAEARPELARTFRAELERFLADRLDFAAREVADEEYVDKLEALGYAR